MGHGRMSCGLKTIRFVIVVVNFTFLIIGLVMVGAGIYLTTDPSVHKLKEVLPINLKPGVEKGLSYLEVLTIAMIVLGSILVIMGFLGCCGAMKQVKVFLIIYAVIIGIIIAIEIGITIYFAAFRSKFEEQILPKLQETVRDTYEGPLGLQPELNRTRPSATSLAWDFIMYNFQCCGVQSKYDFNNTKIWNRANPWWNSSMAMEANFTYPLTCCPIGKTLTTNWNDLPLSDLQSAATCAVTGNSTYSIGCYAKFRDLLGTAQTWIIVVGVVIVLIELMALIFALALCCRKKDN